MEIYVLVECQFIVDPVLIEMLISINQDVDGVPMEVDQVYQLTFDHG